MRRIFGLWVMAVLGLMSLSSCSKWDEGSRWEGPVGANQIRFVLSEDCQVLPDAGYFGKVGLKVTDLEFNGREGLVTFAEDVVEIPDGKLFGPDFVEVELPEGLKSIGDSVFIYSSITHIDLPESLEYIGDEALSRTRLVEIDIPDNVKKIGEAAFVFCRNLVSVELPESLYKIEKETFSCCDALLRIEIPESVKVVGKGAFSTCSSLMTVSLGSVVEIEPQAFMMCSRLTLEIPDSVEKIGRFAFACCCSIYAVSIGKGIREIEVAAFGDCRYLRDIYIMAPEPPVLGKDAFGLPENYDELYVYVPEDCVDKYRAAENFSELADRIMEYYPL